MFSLEGKAISLVVRACKVCSAPLSAGYPCPRCGYEPELAGEEGVIVNATITGDPLVKFARKIAESPEQRWETCKRWVAAALAKGHNPASVSYKWRTSTARICLASGSGPPSKGRRFRFRFGSAWLGMAGLAWLGEAGILKRRSI